jgi:acetyltransferase
MLMFARHVAQGAAAFTDILRLRDGTSLAVRLVVPRDAAALQAYFRALSRGSRSNRLLGAASELTPAELERTLRVGEHGRFAVIAEMRIEGAAVLVGEARYAHDPRTGDCEFALSVADAWQGQGIGAAMLANLECRAAALGAVRLFGETLRDNARMIGLARKEEYVFTTPSDWRLMRFEKALREMADSPCAQRQRAALAAHPL